MIWEGNTVKTVVIMLHAHEQKKRERQRESTCMRERRERERERESMRERRELRDTIDLNHFPLNSKRRKKPNSGRQNNYLPKISWPNPQNL